MHWANNSRQTNPNKTKKIRPLADTCQDLIGSLSLDFLLEEHFPETPPTHPTAILDVDRVVSKTSDLGRAGDTDVPASVQAEITKFQTIFIQGFQRGKSFTGTLPGCTANVQYQLEGSRVMVFCDMAEVSCKKMGQ